MNAECVLATLPGPTDDDRVIVVLLRSADGSSRMSLRQQNWADGIGWYDQKCLDLEPDQFRQLRNLCGATPRPRPRDEVLEPATLLFPGVSRVESA